MGTQTLIRGRVGYAACVRGHELAEILLVKLLLLERLPGAFHCLHNWFCCQWHCLSGQP